MFANDAHQAVYLVEFRMTCMHVDCELSSLAYES